MVQSMLQDRFQLKPHFETRELPIYDLVVGKDGSKIKRSADQTPPSPLTTAPPRPCSPVTAMPAPPVNPPQAPGAQGQPGNPFEPKFVVPEAPYR